MIMGQIRQMTLTFKRSNNKDKGCEYCKSCLRCSYAICIKHEMTDKQREEYLGATPRERRELVIQLKGIKDYKRSSNDIK